MSEPDQVDNRDSRQRMLTLAGGGWVILLAVVFCIAAVAWVAGPALMRGMDPPLGDGVNPESYGFDLSLVNGDRKALTAGMRYRDMVHPLNAPAPLSVEQVNAMTGRNKYMVPSDLVIGVANNGEARAYPLHVLNVHEIVNDTVGDTPVAVTYHWPSGGIRVFDRTLDGQIIELGVSGLLYNGNAVYYDRMHNGKQTAKSSLWSQLEGRPLAGPAASSKQPLETLPTELTTWGAWLDAHPETTVIDRDPSYKRVYKKSNPETGDPSYFTNDDLPTGTTLSHTPSSNEPAFKERVVVVVDENGVNHVYPYDAIASRVDANGIWIDDSFSEPIRFGYTPDPQHVTVTNATTDLPIDAPYSFWFAWHALHPDDQVLAVEASPGSN